MPFAKARPLEHNELKDLIIDRFRKHQHCCKVVAESGSLPTTPIDDSDVEYFMKASHLSQGFRTNPDQLDVLLQCIVAYLNVKHEADAMVAKYSKRGAGASSIDRQELKQMMIDIDEGKAVSDEDVDVIFQESDLIKSGKIERPEIQRAVVMWNKRRKSSAACCSLM